VADEVRAVLQELGDERRLLLEVDVVDRRIGRRPGPVGDDEREALRERPLRPPRGPATPDAAVHEDHAGP
jgi:hypothetical protein